jgi:hypothetical protein
VNNVTGLAIEIVLLLVPYHAKKSVSIRVHPWLNSRMSPRTSPLLALALLLPVPTLGVLSGMVWFPGSKLGVALFFLCKVWMFALPLAWHFCVARQDLATLRPSSRGLGAGFALGLLIAGLVFGLFSLIGRQLIDTSMMSGQLEKIGFSKPLQFVGFAAYWIIVNSLLEEYVWRWFVTQQFGQLARPWLAVILSATAFTLHHIAALQVYFPPGALALSSLGIFIGGVIWSGCFVRYRSIWPGYASHALVDLAIFAIGYTIIF